MSNQDRNEGYAQGWADAQDQVNWEMRALFDENSRLKIRNNELEKFNTNVRNILKW